MPVQKATLAATASLLTAAFAFATAPTDDWPQWRGPTRDGQAPGAAWPVSLGEDRLERLWRVELGPSYSGPIVVGDSVYTTETRDEATEVVTAYDRQSGERRWRAEWPGAMEVPPFAAENGSWIRATPACDGQTLFVVGIRDVLVALDAKSGDERWRVDFDEEYGFGLPMFGATSSPLLTDDALYYQCKAGFVRLDKATGEIVWRTPYETGAPFSSPYVLPESNGKTIVIQNRDAMKAVDAATGKELWSQPIEAFRGMNILTPIAYDGGLFTSAHSGRSQFWRPGEAGGLTEVWRDKSQAYMSSPVVVDDHLYLHLRNQRLQCLDLDTGKEAWRSRPFGKHQSLVAQGDKVLALDSGGELVLFRATPAEFDVLDRRKISDQECWAHVVVCGGQVFVRELNALAAYRWE